jgi:hypothetical protein
MLSVFGSMIGINKAIVGLAERELEARVVSAPRTETRKESDRMLDRTRIVISSGLAEEMCHVLGPVPWLKIQFPNIEQKESKQ